MAKVLYVWLKNNDPNTILWEELDDTAFSKALKKTLINPPTLGHHNDWILFFLFVYKKQGNALGVLIQNIGTTVDP